MWIGLFAKPTKPFPLRFGSMFFLNQSIDQPINGGLYKENKWKVYPRNASPNIWLFGFRVRAYNHVRSWFSFLGANLARSQFLSFFTRGRGLGRRASRFAALEVDVGIRFLSSGFGQSQDVWRAHASGCARASYNLNVFLGLVVIVVFFRKL